MTSKPHRQRPAGQKKQLPRKALSHRPVPRCPTWQLATCEVRSPVVHLDIDLGCRHAVVEHGLPMHLARDLIETVAESSADRGRLIAAAAPSYRTAGRRGRLASVDTDRLLRVGALFEMLRQLFGSDAAAQSHLRLPMKELGDRSAIACSGSIADLDHVQSLFFSQIEISNTPDRPTGGPNR